MFPPYIAEPLDDGLPLEVLARVALVDGEGHLWVGQSIVLHGPIAGGPAVLIHGVSAAPKLLAVHGRDDAGHVAAGPLVTGGIAALARLVTHGPSSPETEDEVPFKIALGFGLFEKKSINQ